MRVEYHVFPLLSQVKAAFGTDQPFAVLLRPDNHIAFLSSDTSPSDTSLEKLHKYFNQFRIFPGESL